MKIKTLWIVLAAVAVLIVPLLIFGGYAAVKYNTLVADSNGGGERLGQGADCISAPCRPCAKLGEHGEGRRCP